MKTTIILGMVLLLSVTTLADINHYYKIDLVYNQGNLSYKSLTVQPSPQPLQTPEGRYIAEVVSYDNKILNLTFFAIPLTIFYDVADPETGELVDGGVITLEQAQTNLYIPYYDNAKEINIYVQELSRRLTIDTSSYVKDAASVAEEIIPGELQPDIQQKADLEPTPMILIGLAIGLLLSCVIIVIIVVAKKRNT